MCFAQKKQMVILLSFDMCNYWKTIKVVNGTLREKYRCHHDWINEWEPPCFLFLSLIYSLVKMLVVDDQTSTVESNQAQPPFTFAFIFKCLIETDDDHEMSFHVYCIAKVKPISGSRIACASNSFSSISDARSCFYFWHILQVKIFLIILDDILHLTVVSFSSEILLMFCHDNTYDEQIKIALLIS